MKQIIKLGLVLLSLLLCIVSANAAQTQSQIDAANQDASETTLGVFGENFNILMGESGAGSNVWWYSGFVFRNVTVPQGITVIDATFQYQADNTPAGTWTAYVYANDVDSAATFGSDPDILGRTTTTAFTSYTNPAISSGTYYNVTNLTAVVQEIVDRGGWSSGNSLMLIFKTQSGTANANLDFTDYETNPSNTPILFIEYGTTPQIQTNITDNGYYNTSTLIGSANTTSNVNMSYFLDGGSEVSICTDCNSSNFTLTNLTQGNHTLNLKSVNNVGTNWNNLSFIIDLENPSLIDNIPAEINTYLLNESAYINFSDTLSPVSCNITYSSGVSSNCQSLTNISLNGNITYNILVNDSAGRTNSTTGLVLVNPNATFSAFDSVRSVNIEEFTIDGYSTTNGVINIPFYDLGLGTHTLNFSAHGYVNESFNITLTNTSYVNQTLNINPVTLSLRVFDELAPSTQLTFNLTINNGSNITQYLNQVNFSAFYNETFRGDLSLTIESIGYSSRKIFTSLGPNTASTNIAYLLPSSNSTPVIFQTLNIQQTQPIENVTLTFKKIFNGSENFLGQAQTDSQGYTYFNMDLNEDYIIIISKEGYVTQIVNSISGRTEYTILMEEDTSDQAFFFGDFAYQFSPAGSIVNSVPFVASGLVIDDLNQVSLFNFSVTYDNITLSNTSTAASGTTLSINVPNESAQYLLKIQVLREGQQYNFTKYLNYYNVSPSNYSARNVAEDLSNEEEESASLIFLMIFGYIAACAVGAVLSPFFGSILGSMALVIFWYIGWLNLGVVTGTIFITLLVGFYFER